jgi:phosphoribosylpyrophosphate synthetase
VSLPAQGLISFNVHSSRFQLFTLKTKYLFLCCIACSVTSFADRMKVDFALIHKERKVPAHLRFVLVGGVAHCMCSLKFAGSEPSSKHDSRRRREGVYLSVRPIVCMLWCVCLSICLSTCLFVRLLLSSCVRTHKHDVLYSSLRTSSRAYSNQLLTMHWSTVGPCGRPCG